ncbi:MAG: carbohydrate binding family 9 domain-containing protein, partial [Planctomycetes bacterium]|nr:carbohydrate binding family 9 domain-containing protein [Planctomycetota bacterium]
MTRPAVAGSADVGLAREAPQAGAAAGGRPVAAATPTADAIQVDGRLDEAAWQTAPPIGALTQREPKEGAAATEATDVRVLFTADVLYFGIVCHDRTPAAIVATQLTRDADLEVDDGILVVVDPFFDQRNGFFFEVNPAGARSDGQVSNNAEETSREWDGIWDARARITADGWVAEIAIPFKTLRFKPGQTTWGLNVERRIKRNNETDRWAAARQDVWVSNLVEAGRLEGLSGIRQGSGLDIKPYALAGEENSDGTFQAGFDVFTNLTSNLNASLTVNTDFAETEVDERQINLTRFPLFFPEKRAFFLEGGGVFDLAGTGGFHQDLVPFFTRRIGLLEGEQVPIAVGAKLIGRASNYNIGLLDVRTRDTADNPEAGQNLLAARVSRNVFQQSW